METIWVISSVSGFRVRESGLQNTMALLFLMSVEAKGIF